MGFLIGLKASGCLFLSFGEQHVVGTFLTVTLSHEDTTTVGRCRVRDSISGEGFSDNQLVFCSKF